MVSRRWLVVLFSSFLQLFFSLFSTAFYEASCFFCCPHFLEASAVFVGRHRSFSLVLLVVFSLLISAVSEAFRRPSWKLLAVFVRRLGSFLLFSSAVLEASVCRSCCFVVGHFLAALASRSCCFLAFFGRSSRCFSSLFFFSKIFLAFHFQLEHSLIFNQVQVANVRSNGTFIVR